MASARISLPALEKSQESVNTKLVNSSLIQENRGGTEKSEHPNLEVTE